MSRWNKVKTTIRNFVMSECMNFEEFRFDLDEMLMGNRFETKTGVYKVFEAWFKDLNSDITIVRGDFFQIIEDELFNWFPQLLKYEKCIVTLKDHHTLIKIKNGNYFWGILSKQMYDNLIQLSQQYGPLDKDVISEAKSNQKKLYEQKLKPKKTQTNSQCSKKVSPKTYKNPTKSIAKTPKTININISSNTQALTSLTLTQNNKFDIKSDSFTVSDYTETDDTITINLSSIIIPDSTSDTLPIKHTPKSTNIDFTVSTKPQFTSKVVPKQTSPKFVLKQTISKQTPPKFGLKQTIPKQTTPKLVLKQTSPKFVLKQTTPQVVPEQITPKVVPEQITPKVVPEQIIPKVVPEQITPKVVPEQITPKVAFKQTIPQVVSEQTIPQVVPKVVLKQSIPQVVPEQIDIKELKKELPIANVDSEEISGANSSKYVNGLLNVSKKEQTLSNILSEKLDDCKHVNTDRNLSKKEDGLFEKVVDDKKEKRSYDLTATLLKIQQQFTINPDTLVHKKIDLFSTDDDDDESESSDDSDEDSDSESSIPKTSTKISKVIEEEDKEDKEEDKEEGSREEALKRMNLVLGCLFSFEKTEYTCPEAFEKFKEYKSKFEEAIKNYKTIDQQIVNNLTNEHKAFVNTLKKAPNNREIYTNNDILKLFFDTNTLSETMNRKVLFRVKVPV